MKIIKSWEENVKLADTLKMTNNNFKNSKFSFLGDLHKGHIEIIKKIKNTSDCLFLQFNELMSFLNVALWKHTNNYNNYQKMNDLFFEYIINDVTYKVGDYVDYLVILPLPEEKKLRHIYNRIYKDFCKIKDIITIELNLPYLIAIEMMYLHLNDPIQQYICSDKAGPKMALQIMLHGKFFNENYFDTYNPDINVHIIWEMITDDKNEVISRTKGDLSWLRPLSIDVINSDISSKEKYDRINKLLYGKLIPNKTFTVINLKNLDRIFEITDNCVIVFGSVSSYEMIYIIDGKTI